MMATQLEAQSTAVAQLDKRIRSNAEALERIQADLAREIGAKAEAILREIRRYEIDMKYKRQMEF